MEALGKELILVNLGARVHLDLIPCLGLVYVPNSSSLLVQTTALLKLHGFSRLSQYDLYKTIKSYPITYFWKIGDIPLPHLFSQLYPPVHFLSCLFVFFSCQEYFPIHTSLLEVGAPHDQGFLAQELRKHGTFRAGSLGVLNKMISSKIGYRKMPVLSSWILLQFHVESYSKKIHHTYIYTLYIHVMLYTLVYIYI